MKLIFFEKYPDDIILCYTPLILLFFLDKDNKFFSTIIILVIISNLMYWNNKNSFTFFLDFTTASLLIIYLIVKKGIKKCILPLLFSSVFLKISWELSLTPKTQLVPHLLFRLGIFYILTI